MKIKHISVTWLAPILCLVIVASSLAFSRAATAEDFKDFDPDAWYAGAVEAAVDNKLLNGVSGKKLNPDGNLTRAEMAAIINRAFGTYKTADISKFTDVSADKWYYKDLQMAVQMGTFQGKSNSTLSPDDYISRQEAMVVMARALHLDLERYANLSLIQYIDANEVPAWALPYVKAMVGAGYVHGREDGSLAVSDTITRAEFAQLFYNVIGEYITEKGTYSYDLFNTVLIRTDNVRLENMSIYGDLIVGCGAGDGDIYLSNVAIGGRLIVWGGGPNSIHLENGTTAAELSVCRVDGPVRVVLDKDSTIAARDTLTVSIDEQAASFEDTRVEFWNEEGTGDGSGEGSGDRNEPVIPPDNSDTPDAPSSNFNVSVETLSGAEINDFQITSTDDESLTVTLPAGDGGVPVIITVSNSRGELLPGITVTLKSQDGTTLGTGQTDVNGQVILPGSSLADEQEELNEQVTNSLIMVTLSADLLGLVDDTEVDATISNNSANDTYVIEIRRNDTGALVAAPISLTSHSSVSTIELLNALPYGSYPCTAYVTATRNGASLGSVQLATTLHIAYLWAN